MRTDSEMSYLGRGGGLYWRNKSVISGCILIWLNIVVFQHRFCIIKNTWHIGVEESSWIPQIGNMFSVSGLIWIVLVFIHVFLGQSYLIMKFFTYSKFAML